MYTWAYVCILVFCFAFVVTMTRGHEQTRTPMMRAMTDQAASSAVTSEYEDVVRIPQSQYRQAVAQIKQQKLQLVAASNLHRLMRDKEEELAATKEEKKELQMALQRSEERLSSIIRLQASTAAPSLPAVTHGLEEDGASCSLRYSDVEADGETASQPQQFSPCIGKQTEKFLNKSVTLESGAVSAVPVTLIPSPAVTSLSAVVSSASTDSYRTCTASSEIGPPVSAVLPSLSSTSNPESKDLLDKVLQQNARLKKTLRDLLSQKGLSVSTYLDRQEYEDAAEILRHDLAEAQKRISQLKSIIASRNNGDLDRITQECARLTDRVAILERKLAISQAYADALKQAHDKCRQGGSHVETSNESTSTPSSANYAQVLEELQKLKEDYKSRETENKSLQTELNQLQQQLKASEESSSELGKLKYEHQLLLEERQLNQSQVAAYEEDFKMEQKEKQELQKKHDVDIAKHQEWVRRLVVEAQKCRAAWQEEVVKREEMENKLRNTLSSSSEWMSSKCLSPASPQQMSLPLTGVVGVDGPPESTSDKRRMDNLVCPRCEREFLCTEKSKWEQHCMRCTDD